MKRIIEKFAKEHNCILNPDKDIVNRIIKGLLLNEKKYGKRRCPCNSNPNAICPCDFLNSDIWKEKGRCYCCLFLKKK